MSDSDKKLLRWAQEQVWWTAAHELLKLGATFMVCGEEEPPGKMLLHKSGGCMLVQRCEIPGWHITLAVSCETAKYMHDHAPTNGPAEGLAAHSWGNVPMGEA